MAKGKTSYTNNLKNRNFGKEAAQNFCLEQATITERQGASEDKDFEVKPTQSKTDSSGYLCIGKRKKFSENMPKLRLKKGVRVSRHDPFKALLDEKLIAQAFWECLKDNDPEGAVEVVSAHINALNKVHLAKETEIPRSTLYHFMKNKNPTIKTVAKLIHCSV
jgi:DNA-binding phage protein